MPPPSTPAQPRFLPSKRQVAPPPQSQGYPPAAELQSGGGAPRFRATPRFSASSTPRPSSYNITGAFSTPLPPLSTSRTSRKQGHHDAIESSPIPSTPERSQEGDGRNELTRSIEIGSPSVSEHSSSQSEVERSPKRRRLSISPDIDTTSQLEAPQEESFNENDNAQMIEEADDETSYHSSDPILTGDLDSTWASQDDADSGSESPSLLPTTPGQVQHPAFRRPPRFKTAEAADASAQVGQLPDAFSPQRRGVRYVPGGLASELRDWLVQVKGSAEYDKTADDQGMSGVNVRLRVEQVRPAPGMWLVAGRRVGEDREGSPSAGLVRAILAGEGRLAGLGKKGLVRSTCTVAIMQPVWDVVLEGEGTWTVACDWAVVEEDELK